jgi:Fe-S cluster assembly protein SufD
MTQLAERNQTYLAEFEAWRHEPAFGRDALASARERAFNAVIDRGFPTTRDEEWRFTNIAPMVSVAFERPGPAAGVSRDAIGQLTPDLGLPVVVINGRVVEVPKGLPAGVTVRTLRDAQGIALLPKRADGASVFVDLNTAFFEDLVAIDIGAGVVLATPLHVMFVSTGNRRTLVTPRLVISVGERAQASIVESYVDEADQAVLANAVTDVHVGAGAIVDHVKYQRQSASSFHMATMFAKLERSATFTSHSLVLGGRIVRNDLIATLDGEGAECTLNGLYVASGESLVDNHTTIDHAKAHCPSHEVYKGILSGRAKAVFNGKILVRQDAQKTDAKQTNKALLLTDEAQVNTKPQLEIFADDVKCTHGAAIGQLDEDALFYLKARGIAAGDARNMLIHAFAGQVLDGVKSEALRQAAMTRVEELLGLPA